MNCKLCLQDRKLCRSHIIPEFCFSLLYDDNHHFINMYDVRQEKTCLGQTGWKEPLLCPTCEGIFAKYERHSRRLFTDQLPAPRKGTKRYFDLPRLDHFKLRYFFLSILWRASVAKSPMFKHVALGQKHEQLLRGHLLAETLPEYDDYGCWVLALHYDSEPLKDIIVEPTHCRIEGHRVYRFVFAGIVLFAFVSSHPVSDKLRRFLLGATSQVTVYRADLPELGFLRQVWHGG